MMDCSGESLQFIPTVPSGIKRLQLNDNSLASIKKIDLGDASQLEVLTVANNFIDSIEVIKKKCNRS